MQLPLLCILFGYPLDAECRCDFGMVPDVKRQNKHCYSHQTRRAFRRFGGFADSSILHLQWLSSKWKSEAGTETEGRMMPQRTHLEMTGVPDPAKVMAMLAEMDPKEREFFDKMMKEKADE